MLKRTQTILIRALEITVVIAVLLISFSYVYFRYFKETTLRPAEPLSVKLGKEINNSLDRAEVINGVQIVKVDLKRNVRYLVHTYWKIPELQKLYDNFSSTRITSEIPVFSRDEVQNARIIRIMNHEFDCTPFKDTLSYKLVPESAEHIAVVCSISIPPAFSDFKGIIAASLSRVPTDFEKNIVKNTLIDISESIYKEIK
jgi:hypothetical protein